MNPLSSVRDVRAAPSASRSQPEAPARGESFAELLQNQPREGASATPAGGADAKNPPESLRDYTWQISGQASRQNGPEELSSRARAERDAHAEESDAVDPTAERASTDEVSAKREEGAPREDDESEPAPEAETAPQRAGEAKGEAALAVAEPAAELDDLSGEAEVDAEPVKAKTGAVDQLELERVDADPGEDVGAEVADEVEVEADSPDFESFDAADVEVEAPAPIAKADAPTFVQVDGARGATGYDAVGRGVRMAAADAPAPTWDAEVVEQLRSQHNLRALESGKLQLEVREAGERMTLTLQERDGALHLVARTSTRAMADAMNQRVEELRAALADLGLAFGGLEAQADPREQQQSGGEGQGGASDELAGPAEAPTPRPPLWVSRKRIIA